MSRVYLIFGSDEFSVNAKAGEIVAALVPDEERAFGLEELDGKAETTAGAISALKACIEALRTPGFLGSGKVVCLRDADCLGKGQAGATDAVKALVNELAGMIERGLPAGQTLVITAPNLDGRSALYKACKAQGEIHEFSFAEKAHKAKDDARARVISESGRLKLGMSRALVETFLERVGGDTRQIVSEMEKLSLYMGERRPVSTGDIDTMVSASREVATWDLADAVCGKNLSDALVALRRLLFQKEAPIWLVSGLLKRMDELALLREAMDKGWASVGGDRNWPSIVWKESPEVDAALSGLGKDNPRNFHPFRAGKLAAQAKGFSASELFRCREMIIQARKQLVQTVMPEQLVLELLLVGMLGPCGRTKPAPIRAAAVRR